MLKPIMKISNKIYLLLKAGLFFTIFSTISFPTLALSTDSKQPVTITSDIQSLDITNNISVFLDNVIIKQGSIEIKANKVVVIRSKGEQQKTVMECFGTPVTFQQMQDNGKFLIGHSEKIRYQLSNQFLVLAGDASLKKLDIIIEADCINYHVKSQIIEAFSNHGKRVTNVFVPMQLKINNPNSKKKL